MSFKTQFQACAVKFSPFEEGKLAVATAQNFGIIGNGKQVRLSGGRSVGFPWASGRVSDRVVGFGGRPDIVSRFCFPLRHLFSRVVDSPQSPASGNMYEITRAPEMESLETAHSRLWFTNSLVLLVTSSLEHRSMYWYAIHIPTR